MEFIERDVPASGRKRRGLLHSLVGVEPPEPIDKRFLGVRSRCLAREGERHKVASVSALTPMGSSSELCV